MKETATGFLLLLNITLGFSQGSVSFQNGAAELSSPPDRLIRFACANTPGNVFGTKGAPAVGTNLQVQLYYGTSTAAESALVPLSSAPARMRPSTTGVPGTWSGGGSKTFSNGGVGDVLNLQVRAWDLNYGTTYETATGGIRGKSAIFSYTVPAPTDGSAAFHMNNFLGFSMGPACASPPASILAGELSGPGFRVTLAGQVGTRSQIEASTNLHDWTPLAIITNESGTAQFTDPFIAGPCRFYRVVQLE